MTSSPGWRDDPLSSAAADELGTVHVARRTAQLVVDTHSFESSTVVGLVGPWGSGKSSIVAMTCEALNQREDDVTWSIGRFTPWATNDVESMMADFYATLAALLPKDKARKVRKGLTQLARMGTASLKLVPVAGDAASEVARVAVEQLVAEPSWDETFTQVSRRLAKLHVPVLIVVDDVDRLQQAELTTLLKVIRLLGRFPGVSYLLAYDEQTLFATLKESALAAHNDATARLFMEKVVQYPVTVPPLLSDQIIERLDKGLDVVFDDLGRSLVDADSRLSSLTEVYVSQLRTPRALNRFLAQVRLTLSMHEPGEVDDIDVVLVTLLRVQFPDVYAQLPRWKLELTGSMSMRRMLRDDNAMRGGDATVDFAPLFVTVTDPVDRDDAAEIVALLFPATVKHVSYAGVAQSMRNKDYFDRYLVHTVPASDIPDAQVRAALREASQGEGHDHLSSLLTKGSTARIDLAVSHLWTASRELVDELDVMNVLGAVMAEWATVPQEHRFLFDTRQRLTGWAAELISRLPETAIAEDLLGALTRCSEPEGPLLVLWDARERREDVAGAPVDSSVAGVASLVASAGRRVAEQAMEDVLHHLRDGDDAEGEFTALLRLFFIDTYGDADAMVARVREGLEEGAFSVETLASRCVSVAYTAGGVRSTGRLHGFERDLFAMLVNATDPFFDKPKESGVDKSDLSWANRRRYARGRAMGPPADQRPTEG